LRFAAAAVLVGALLFAPAAMAGQPCAKAMFTCRGTQVVEGVPQQVVHGKNLRQLIFEERRGIRWIKRHCTIVTRDPFQCDWQRSVRTKVIAGRRPARRPEPTAIPPASPPSTARRAIPAVARKAARRAYSGVSPAPVRAPVAKARERKHDAEIRTAATRYKLPADFIAAVMTVESGGNPRAVSHAGAQGLMQLMPSVAKAMGVVDPFDPAQNILGGARYLRVLANRFGGDIVKVLSAYHAGSSRVKKRGGTPFSATDSYVRKVLRVYYALRDG